MKQVTPSVPFPAPSPLWQGEEPVLRSKRQGRAPGPKGRRLNMGLAARECKVSGPSVAETTQLGFEASPSVNPNEDPSACDFFPEFICFVFPFYGLADGWFTVSMGFQLAFSPQWPFNASPNLQESAYSCMNARPHETRGGHLSPGLRAGM